MFRVIEQIVEADPASAPRDRRVVQDGILDFDGARRAANAEASRFEVHGYNPENDHWWGRNEGSGARRIYHVEASIS